MEQYKHVHLILDRDTAGMNDTRKAMQWDVNKYIDRSDFYHILAPFIFKDFIVNALAYSPEKYHKSTVSI